MANQDGIDKVSADMSPVIEKEAHNLNALYQCRFEEGYKAGYNVGHSQGYRAGFKAGYEVGEKNGYAKTLEALGKEAKDAKNP